MPKDHDQKVEEKLDVVIELLKNLLALNLSQSGVTQDGICKHVHASKTDVVRMLQGVKKEKKAYG